MAVRSFWGLAFRISRLGLVFFASLILARLMTLKDYGTYQYVMSMATLLLIPGLCGLNRLLVREIATNQTMRRPDLTNGVLTFGVVGTALTSLTVALIVSALIAGSDAYGWFGATDASLGGAVFLGMVALVLLAMTQVFQGGAQGFHHTTTGQLPELVINPVAMLLIVSVGWLVGVPLTANLALGYQIAAALIGALTALYFMRRAIAPDVRAAKRQVHVKTWMVTAVGFVFINGMYTVNTQADVFMLGFLKGPEYAGLYYPASRYSQLVNLGLLAVYVPLSPMIASQFTQGNIKGVERTARFAAYLGLACALPAAVLFWVAGPFFLSLFGQAYIPAAAALSILCFGQIFTASMGPSVNSLTMTGYSRYASYALLVGAVVNVILNAVLIPSLDIRGAAIATACSTVVWNVVSIWFIVRLLNVNPTAFGPSLQKRAGTGQTAGTGQNTGVSGPSGGDS